MIELLFRQKEHQKVGKMLKNLWNRRLAILKYMDSEKEREKAMNDTISSTKSDPGPEGNRYTPIERGSRGFSMFRG